MINKNEKQVELAFGKGDICIAGGCYFNEDGNKLGMVAFINQDSVEIGSPGIIEGGKEYNIEDFPVIMTFAKKESIDVVIDQLQIAKAEMEMGDIVIK